MNFLTLYQLNAVMKDTFLLSVKDVCVAKLCAVLAKVFAASPGYPAGLGAGRGEDRQGSTMAKGNRDQEVDQEETWCYQ